MRSRPGRKPFAGSLSKLSAALTPVRPASGKQRAKAADLADKSLLAEEQQHRKRQLIRGPKEFHTFKAPRSTRSDDWRRSSHLKSHTSLIRGASILRHRSGSSLSRR
jgi:hypothetical protein